MKNLEKTIEDYCKNHGTYVLLEELRHLCMKSLSQFSFSERIQTLLSAGVICMEGNRVYLSRVWRQEEYAAERLSTILGAQPLPEIILPPTIKVGGIILTEEQRNAVSLCLNHRLTLLLSPAGCGKTTIAQAIVQFAAGPSNYLICSPTGKAAKIFTEHTGLSAATVHRSLGVRNADEFLMIDRMDEVGLIVVDEGTMLTIDMLSGLLRAAPDHCRIVIMGDRRQLPAVGAGNVIHDLVALGFPVAQLTFNHRQSISAGALRSNVLNFDNIHWCGEWMTDSSFQYRCYDDDAALMDALVEDAVARYTRGDQVQVLAIRKDDVLALNRRIQLCANPPIPGKPILQTGHFTFVEGDRVIIVENDNKRGCYNGETGILHIADDGGFSVELEDGRCPVWPVYHVPTNIMPAYAITVHRAQGSAYDAVLMYVPRCPPCLLHRNTLYTGISRAKDTLVLYGNLRAVEFGLHTPPPERSSALVEKTRRLCLPSAG